MTNIQFQDFLNTLDSNLGKMRREIQHRGEDEFDPFLFSQALLLKMQVALALIGKQVGHSETPFDLHNQNEGWLNAAS